MNLNYIPVALQFCVICPNYNFISNLFMHILEI